MFASSRLLALALVLAPLAALGNSPLEGRWRMDPARSTALDGWTAWDLVVSVDDTRVSLRHDMRWRSTTRTATNVVDTSAPTEVAGFFRVEQRHMALYPAKGGVTTVSAGWLDSGRTLRVEAGTPVEASQGIATMRLSFEYRVLEGDDSLVLVELHGTRPQPLVYRFNRVKEAN